MTRMQLAGSIVTLGLLATLIGCKKTNPSPTQPPTFPQADANANADTGPHAAGKRIFAANCARCHSVGGAPMAGGPMAGGPGGFGGGPGGPMVGGPGGFGGGPGGPGGRMGGMRGPDLGKVGQAAEHTVAWLTELIRDPKSKKENARMPPFGGKINDADLKLLAEYLVSLK